MDSIRKIRFSLLSLFILLGGGTAGYVQIEGWSVFESLYMTTITLATVGYSEVHQLSPAGKLFTIILIIFGVGTIAYTLGLMIQFMVEGQLQQMLGRKKVEKEINRLSDHYIICGFGRIGRLICQQFAAKPQPFIVVESRPERCQEIRDKGYLCIEGDATQDQILEQAGITRAKGLISVVTSDSENVFIVLSARGMKDNLFILARASDESAEVKLLRAGANKVVSPYTMGANRMAQAVLRPSVVDFIDLATGQDNIELQLEEIPVSPASELVGRNLIDTGIRRDLGLIIVGIKKPEKMLFNPAANTGISAGDILIALGECQDIKRLELIAARKTL